MEVVGKRVFKIIA
jgi:serine/threonine-protein phosphatase 2A regulatory subunit B''